MDDENYFDSISDILATLLESMMEETEGAEFSIKIDKKGITLEKKDAQEEKKEDTELPAEIIEDGKFLYIAMHLPGIEAASIKVLAMQEKIDVSYKRNGIEEKRSINLPKQVSLKGSVEYKNGVLNIIFKKIVHKKRYALDVKYK